MESVASVASTRQELPRAETASIVNAVDPVSITGVGFTRTLTDKGGAYELPEAQRAYICLLEDFRLFVSNSHRVEPSVLSFLARLDHDGVRYKTIPVSVNDIRALYQRASLDTVMTAANLSAMQGRVMRLLKDAVAENASDVHIVVREDDCTIRMRVDGDLTDVSFRSNPTAVEGTALQRTIYQSMCDLADSTFRPHRMQDARLAKTFVGELGLYGARVATRPTDAGLLMVLRLLYDRTASKPTLDSIGLLPVQVKLVRRMKGSRTGISILSGPTGAGKSTTLECVLTEVVKDTGGRKNVITVENPVEYAIQGTIQTPIMADGDDPEAVSLAWVRSISNVLRLDPDVLMIGEMRDAHSAKAAFHAAMTGHSVWTTLHANDAFSILERLAEMGIPPSLMFDPTLVVGLVNQGLVKKLCPYCSVPLTPRLIRTLPEDLVDRISETCNDSVIRLRGAGCPRCKQKGIKGRAMVSECIVPTQTLMSVFKNEGKIAARQMWVRQLNGITKNAALLDLVRAGSVDPRDAEEDICLLDEDATVMES